MATFFDDLEFEGDSSDQVISPYPKKNHGCKSSQPWFQIYESIHKSRS